MSRNAIAERAVELVRAGADPETATSELVNLAGGRRAPLEEASLVFVGRLHRRRDDFEATKALRLVDRALGQLWEVEVDARRRAAGAAPQPAAQPPPEGTARKKGWRSRLRRLMRRWRPAWGA